MQIPASTRRVAIAAGAVLILGGSAVGIAAAQSAPPSTPTSGYQKFIDALAQKLGVSSQTLQQDIAQVRQDQGLPANGGFPGAHGPRGGFRFDLQAAAQAIGISTQQLQSELPGKSLAQVAQAHGKTATDVATALKNAANTRIDQAVQNNRITQDQANTQKTNLDQHIDNMVNQVMPQRGAGGPGGVGFGRGMIRQGLDTAAQAIGISTQQLQTELPGKSLAQVAQAHGKTATDVATALKNAANTRVDQAVQNNRVTQDQANTQKTNLDQRIDNMVNQVMPQRGAGGPGGVGSGRGMIRQGLDTAAQAIGISTQQLQTELPGKSLAQVAQAHGKTGTDVATALKNAANTRIDQAVQNNRVTQDQANTQKTNLDQRIDNMVNQVMPQGGFGPGRRGPGGQDTVSTGA